MTVDSSAVDAAPMLLNVLNGTLDFRTASKTGRPRRLKHHPKRRITKLVNAKWNPNAKCPRFLAFLDEIFDGDKRIIRFVRRVFGYSLLGLVREHAFFILVGSGGNGKSALLGIIYDILGDYSAVADFSTFAASKSASTGPRSDLVRLRGKRCVMCNEIGDIPLLSEATVKKLTGGDPIVARGLYREEIEFRPEFKVLLAANGSRQRAQPPDPTADRSPMAKVPRSTLTTRGLGTERRSSWAMRTASSRDALAISRTCVVWAGVR